jgi:hypothetical protein
MSADADGRFCSNCRAELPPDVEACPSCGVFAGEMFDGRTDVQKRSLRKQIWRIVLLLLVLGAVGGSWFAVRDSPSVRKLFAPAREQGPTRVPTRVVSNRPGGERRARGARLTESEAVRILRRELTSTGEKPVKNECLAIIGNGERGSAYLFTAVDACERTRLGKWRVDGKTEAVSRAVSTED